MGARHPRQPGRPQNWAIPTALAGYQAQHTTPSTEPDQIIWKWSAIGTYSARSCYLATFQGSASCSASKLIWKTWASPKVKFFHWLANLDRCWTAERLQRCGLQHHPRCVLCDQEPEAMRHLLVSCTFSRQVWHDTLSWLRMTCRPPDHDNSLNDWWLAAKETTPKPLHKGLATVTLLTGWMIWKQRNTCVFDGDRPSAPLLAEKIRADVALWARTGASGLRLVLPNTWDVH